MEELRCKVCGCLSTKTSRFYKKHMLCNKHYQKLLKYGETTNIRTIYTPNEIIKYDNHAEIILYDKYGKEINRALIDLEDIDKVKNFKWCINPQGYAICSKGIDNKKYIRLHHYIFTNPNEDNLFIDHINRNRLDNRKSNLRIVSKADNNKNLSLRTDNNTNIIGVCYDNERNKWISQLKLDGKRILFKRYNNIDDAIIARLKAELKYLGEFAPQKHLFEKYNIAIDKK